MKCDCDALHLFAYFMQNVRRPYPAPIVLAKGQKNHLQGCDFFSIYNKKKKKKNCMASEWGSDAKKNKCSRILHSQNGIVSGWFLSHKITSIVQKIQNPINFWQIKCPTVDCTQWHTRYTLYAKSSTEPRYKLFPIHLDMWVCVCVFGLSMSIAMDGQNEDGGRNLKKIIFISLRQIRIETWIEFRFSLFIFFCFAHCSDSECGSYFFWPSPPTTEHTHTHIYKDIGQK